MAGGQDTGYTAGHRITSFRMGSGLGEAWAGVLYQILYVEDVQLQKVIYFVGSIFKRCILFFFLK